MYLLMPSILRRVDSRKKSEICLYLAKCTVFTVNQGGNADKGYSSLTEDFLCSVGDFFVANNF